MDPETQALAVQQQWARSRGIELTDDGRWFADPADALFARSLRPETRAEFADGDGNELDRMDRLRSSSCLAVNVFEPWRDNPAPVAEALQAGPASTMRFEEKQPTGLRGIPPNLDVLLGGSGAITGVECKYLEPYGLETNSFRPSYFEKPGLWDEHPDLEAIARRVHEGDDSFRRLKVAQLIKHALGMQHSQPSGFALRLVWFRLEHRHADELQIELDRFTNEITTIDFKALTYQDVIVRLGRHPEPAPGYFEYLRGRYGLNT